MKYRERLSGIKSFIAHFVLLVFSFLSLYGQKVSTSVNIVDELKTYSLSNDKISVSVTVDSGKLVSDEVKGQPDWLKQYGT